jgi:ankyrin repeat protein
LIDFILKSSPKVLTVRNNEGSTPLHIACSVGFSNYDASNVERVRYPITRAPDGLALQDSYGHTPLHLLLRKDHMVRRDYDVVKSLDSFTLKANPKVLTVRDNEGFIPLLVASQLKLPLNVIYRMLRFDPQWDLSSSWFSDSKMCGPIQRKRKRYSRPQD